MVGQQYKCWKAEATKLAGAITEKFTPASQKRVLKESHSRSSTNAMRKGTVGPTRDAAAELNKLAKQLGMDLKFTSGQPRPIHPVG